MANVFSGNAEKKVPKNLKECYVTDNTGQSLWLWCERLEEWGKFLFWFIIISGLVLAISSSIMVREVMEEIGYTDAETYFDVKLFIGELVSVAIYAFLEYCAYHVLSILIASLATIVQNTKITANIALYNTAKEEGVLEEEPKAIKKSGSSSPKVVNSSGSWICKECGTKNDAGTLSCKDCGKYK